VGDVARAGYRILTHSPEAGVDAFVRPGGAPALYFQGHPEYDADTLAREYLRDVGRFLRGERPLHPPMPHGYFDARTQRILANMTRCGEQAPRPELIADYAGIVEAAAPKPIWRATGLGLVGGWLGSVLERARAATPLARAWSSPAAIAG
jgi:homoserine O-succinyltransferase